MAAPTGGDPADTRPRIVITHGYTDSNKGDAAIALATVAAIRRVLPQALITSHSNYAESHAGFANHSRLLVTAGVAVREGILPSPYRDDHGRGARRDAMALLRLAWDLLTLAVLRRWPDLAGRLHPRKARALNDLAAAALVIARGGQYLHNESGRARGAIFLGRMLHTIAVPVRLGRPTTILGLSIGPLHGRWARSWVRRTLRGCRHVVVRETLSSDDLRALGVVDNVLVAPDLAFLTEPSPEDGGVVMLPSGRWIAVSVINWAFHGHRRPGQALARYVDVLEATLVAGAAGLGLVPVLVAQVTAQHHGRGDEALLSELYARLRAAGVPARLVTEDLTPAQLSFLYGQCEVVLASRLHSAILAACAGTPPVAIGYQGFKTAGIMRDLEMETHAHAIETVTAEALLTSIGLVVTDRTTLSADIRRRVEAFRREIHDVVGRVVTVPPTPSGQAGEAWAATISSRMAGTS